MLPDGVYRSLVPPANKRFPVKSIPGPGAKAIRSHLAENLGLRRTRRHCSGRGAKIREACRAVFSTVRFRNLHEKTILDPLATCSNRNLGSTIGIRRSIRVGDVMVRLLVV